MLFFVIACFYILKYPPRWILTALFGGFGEELRKLGGGEGILMRLVVWSSCGPLPVTVFVVVVLVCVCVCACFTWI